MKRPYDSYYWRNIIRPTVLQRDPTCQLRITKKCRTVSNEAHHIIDWQDGGPWFDLDNLQGVCKACNVTARNRRQAAAVRRERNATPPPTPSRQW